MSQAALEHLKAGRLPEAVTEYERYLSGAPTDAEAWYQLATTHFHARSIAAAATAIARAMQLQPGHVPYLLLAGNIAQDQRQLDVAQAFFEEAIAANPTHAGANNNLGVVLRDRGHLIAAENAFRRAAASDPRYVRAHNNLGSTLAAQGRAAEAIESFRRAIAIDPDYAHAWINLGTTLERLGENQAALDAVLRATTIAPTMAPAWAALAAMHRNARRIDQALVAAERVTALLPLAATSWITLAEIRGEAGDAEGALAAFAKAQALAPTALRAGLGVALTLPQIYITEEDVALARRRYAAGLSQLEQKLATISIDEVPASERLRAAAWSNFFLAYQGENDREMQTRFAAIQRKLLESVLPQFYEARRMPPVAGRRIRIGFCSRYWYESTPGHYFKPWIVGLDRARFEIFVFALGSETDPLQQAVEAAASRFIRLQGSLESMAQTLADAALDVLIYPELGMDARCTALGSMRLAPIQCMGWGHPVTSGHANMDVAFSASEMEPEDGNEHYSERLIRLPGIGTQYIHPGVPAITRSRADFGLPDNRILYLFPQSLFKIHPRNDQLLINLLKAEPRAVLVMFQGQSKIATTRFMARLKAAFQDNQLSVAERIKLLPGLSHTDYLELTQLCDVMLDSLFWSGGNTSLDALACGLPIITLPGRLMRGRQSYGMLKLLGLENDLIARSESHYVDIALRLGRDTEFRQSVRTRICANLNRIFGDPQPIRALEQHLITLVEGGHGRVDRP